MNDSTVDLFGSNDLMKASMSLVDIIWLRGACDVVGLGELLGCGFCDVDVVMWMLGYGGLDVIVGWWAGKVSFWIAFIVFQKGPGRDVGCLIIQWSDVMFLH